MTILSDRQIKELCIEPLCTYQPATLHFGGRIDKGMPQNFWGTEEEFDTFVEEQKKVGLVTVRYTPQEAEVAEPFKPMIYPFVDGQVREVIEQLDEMEDDRRENAEWLCHEAMSSIIGDALSLKIFKADRDAGLGEVDDNLSDILVERGVHAGLKHLFYQGNKFICVADYFQRVYETKVSADNVQTKRIISYGLSSYGYDLRLGNKFKIFTNVNSTVINPKDFDNKSFVDYEGDVCIVPPNSFVLAASMERIAMPRNVTGVVLGKSTYARCGIDCLATPLEAGWEGHVTLEFANTTPLPAMLFAGEGCCQVLFLAGEQCITSYADRKGKYQNQEEGPVTPRV